MARGGTGSSWRRCGLYSTIWGVLASGRALAQPSPLIYDAPAASQEFVVDHMAQCGGGAARVFSSERVPVGSFQLDKEKLKCEWGAIVAGDMAFHAFTKPFAATLDRDSRYAVPTTPTGDRNVSRGKFGARINSSITPTNFFLVWGYASPAKIESQEKCPKNGAIQAMLGIPKPNGIGDVLEANGECELSAFSIDSTRNTYVRNNIGEPVSFETLQTNTVTVELSQSDGFGGHMGPGTGAPYIEGKVTLRTVHKFEARPRLEVFPAAARCPGRPGQPPRAAAHG
jgi:hypothetical protein